MLAPLSEGGMGMSSAELQKWEVFFKIRAKDNAPGGTTTDNFRPQTMTGSNNPMSD